jgi:hypothetical protein
MQIYLAFVIGLVAGAILQAHDPTKPAQAAAAPVVRWEYEFLSETSPAADFAKLGAQGWEACAGTRVYVVFKRRLAP